MIFPFLHVISRRIQVPAFGLLTDPFGRPRLRPDCSLLIHDWRNRGREEWEMARWVNGMDAAKAGLIEEGKTIVCGHWHCSYGHSEYEGIGSEFGPDADFSPYYAPGIIALDACTAHSGRVNVVVLED